jgi:hypothetical protein
MTRAILNSVDNLAGACNEVAKIAQIVRVAFVAATRVIGAIAFYEMLCHCRGTITNRGELPGFQLAAVGVI